MIGKRNKFDQHLFNKYDPPAREKVKACLGDFVCDNPNIYGEDMIIKSDTCRYKYLELQVCANWFTDEFPYQLPFVYARKAMYSDKTLFLILDKNFTKGLLFGKESLNDKPKRRQKYSREFIYEVPWKNVMRVYLDFLSKEDIESY